MYKNVNFERIYTDNLGGQASTAKTNNTRLMQQSANMFEIAQNTKASDGNSQVSVGYMYCTITQEQVEEYADKLNQAMSLLFADKEKVEDILLNSNLNSFDIVQIMVRYSEMNNSYLANDIAKKFIGKTENQFLEKLATSCFEVAFSDDPIASRKASNHLNNEKALNDFASANYNNDLGNIKSSTMITGIRG